jgi:hypothetical protein
MEHTEPASVTARDIRDLVHASSYCDAALSIVMGTDIIVVGPAYMAERTKVARIVLRGSEVRPLLATFTKHVEREFTSQNSITLHAATLLAMAVNRRITDVVNGTAVQVIE